MLHLCSSIIRTTFLGVLLAILTFHHDALAAIPATSIEVDSTLYQLNERDLYKVPEWAKHVVWYQIFPERFWNGDRTNDPTLDDIQGAYPDDQSPWHIHPWTSDWFALQDYELQNNAPLRFKAQRRRYGGDLQGILDKLDYLEDLGINAIYLNPVFYAPSFHKYDAKLLHHVDPTFGPDPVGDRDLMAMETPDDPNTWVWTAADQLLLQLIQEVHHRGMYIILDGVFNHIGHTSWAFEDVKQKQQASPYTSWFTILSWSDSASQTPFRYQCWNDDGEITELPEFRQNEQGIVAGPKDYIHAITQRWLDPNGDGDPSDGIDGWRLDAALMIQHPFWQNWRRWVKSINPNAYLVAEVLQPNADVLEPYLQGDEFDAAMNYQLAFAYAEHFIQQQVHISLTEFDQQLQKLRDIANPEVAYVMQNLLGSHDVPRIVSRMVNSDIGHFRILNDRFGIKNGHSYQNRKPNHQEIQQQKLWAIFQMTYVGAPMIYYGDEVGMWGGSDPHNRKPMVWSDLNYDPEKYEIGGRLRDTPDSVEFNSELFNHYRKLIHIRQDYLALQTGDFQVLHLDDDNDVYIFTRTIPNPNGVNSPLIIALNNSLIPQTVTLNSPSIQALNQYPWKDILNDCLIASINEKGPYITLTIPPQWGRILVSQNL